ncbi:MAG: hypothetical protein LUD47_02160 [Clostridia bacterium]|nr:hypothetical protein [Clostridia bacterium]
MKVDEKEQAGLGFVLKVALQLLNEKDSQKFFGRVANYFGYDGVSLVRRLMGVARSTIFAGSKDASADAIIQIEKKKYEADMKDCGIGKIDKYGMAFCGQHVIVRKA